MSLHTIYKPILSPHPAIVGLKNPQRQNRQSFIIRFLTFTFLETSFLFLGAWCLTHPIQLPISIANGILIQDAKAITTAISVLWHALAGLVAKDIILQVFSAEWAALYCYMGTLQPNQTDAVSVITSGLLDQLKHAILQKSTPHFCLSLAITLVLLGLGPLGASTLGINLLWVDTIQEIQVANITIDYQDASFSEALERAGRIAKSEMLDHLPIGYNISSQDTLIPWPHSSFSNHQGVIKYMSDIALYNYSCNWLYSTFLDIQNLTLGSGPETITTVNVQNTTWSGDGLGILWFCEDCGPAVTIPLWPDSSHILGQSTFLFAGNNATYHNTSHPLLNLSGIPSTFFNNPAPNDGFCDYVASILACNPQFKITSAEITLNNGELSAKTLMDQSLTGNLHQNSVATFFERVFNNPLVPRGDGLCVPINDMGSFVFFSRPIGSTEYVAPLNLESINQNMQIYVQHAAKAFLSGNNSTNTTVELKNPTNSWMLTNATIQEQQLALTTSKSFFLCFAGVLGFLEISLLVLVMTIDPGTLMHFNLQTLQIVFGLQGDGTIQAA